MAILTPGAKWLLLMKKKFNIDFSNVAMLGRQWLNVDKGLSPFFNLEEIRQPDGYSEKFWSVLAGKEAHVDSFDFSDYEHATVLHDMNKPIPDEHKNKYSVVFDGGTFEHVYNYPVALHNAMNMTLRGGYLILNTPANNWCGHGFYQFSPELFFSVLNEANGFQILDITAIGLSSNFLGNHVDQYFHLDTTQRNFVSDNPVLLHICAKRIGEIPALDKMTIQQSYYVNAWDNGLPSDNKGGLISKIKALISRVPFLYKPLIRLYHKLGYGHAAKQYDIDKALRQ